MQLVVNGTNGRSNGIGFEVRAEEIVVPTTGTHSSFLDGVTRLVTCLGIDARTRDDTLVLPRYSSHGSGSFDLSRVLTNLQTSTATAPTHSTQSESSLEPIDFPAIKLRAKLFADLLESKRATIIRQLTRYETSEVAADEIERSLDLFRNIGENEQYYSHRINSAASLLPKNQPLYALSCFGLAISFMTRKTFVRPPQVMHEFFSGLEKTLELERYFPNVRVQFNSREEFVEQACKQVRDPRSGQLRPATEAVIFTGTMENADKLRGQLDQRTLLIANGAGHNPIVVGADADLKEAAFCAARVQLYNQGQDCANPSAILVHDSIYEPFLSLLREQIRLAPIGPYSDPAVRVGPISEIADLPRIHKLLFDNARWIDGATPGVMRVGQGIVEPTIIARPLADGGNYSEQFAPIFFVQRYDNDAELARYFETPAYRRNAMYVCLFGSSPYVDALPNFRDPSGNRLHDESTIVREADLHAPGVERGVKPYGGYGRGASCLSINGAIVAKPTLPQRDIFEHIVCPRLAELNEKS